jgi:cell division protein FtsW
MAHSVAKTADVEVQAPIVKPAIFKGDGRPFDSVLLAVVIALVGIGLVMVYSASSVQTLLRHNDEMLYLNRQLRNVAIGLTIMLVAMRVDYRWYRRLTYPILGLALGGLAVVLVLGVEFNEAKRWIRVGRMTVQPSEFLKLALVMYMAYSVEKKDHKLKRFSIGFIPHLMVLSVAAFLLMMQPDFGTTVICAVLVFSMLFVAGARIGYIAMFGVAGLGAATLMVMTSEYRRNRVMAYLNPEADPLGISYQINQSLMAIGSGGMFGKGLGAGRGKLGYVPELWNDFIGTAIGEELGLVGLATICLLFVMLLWRGLKIAYESREMYGMYLAFGITMIFGLQATVNLCVVTGLLPNKGLTLPFVSYGGSSTFMCLFAVGLLLNISKSNNDGWERGKEERKSKAERARLERRGKAYLRRKAKRE